MKNWPKWWQSCATTCNRWLALWSLGVAGGVEAGVQLQWPVESVGKAEWGLEELVSVSAAARWAQPTQSGRLESALFGCVRNGGTRFHEGIDIGSSRRGAGNEPLEAIRPVAAGTVRYINRDPGTSSYGRYIVLEHDQWSVPLYSLYAHLASVDARLEVGEPVDLGSRLGVMGNSAGGYRIPMARAHLHFEIGLCLSSRFEDWYRRQEYPEANAHGIWNGLNLLGLDPLSFLREFSADTGPDPVWWNLRTRAAALEVVVETRMTPDFVDRYPRLVRGLHEPGETRGWKIKMDKFGFPFEWERMVEDEEEASLVPGRIELEVVEAGLLRGLGCRDLIASDADGHRPGADTLRLLDILFQNPGK